MSNHPLLDVAVHSARRAASVIVDAARDIKRRPSHARDRGEIASNASAEAENALIATLRAAYPDHAIVGKEAGEIVHQIQGSTGRERQALKWIIDPIDGMLNFHHGYPFYAVAIALMEGEESVLAVVLDPVHDDLFTAVKGKGAQHNGAPIRTSACIGLDEALVAGAIPVRGSAKQTAHLAVQNALTARCADIRRAGATMLDLAYVAAGRLDGFWALSEHPGDLAAGLLIVNEAGGRVGDLAGGADFTRTNEVIAAAPGIFNPLREAIAQAMR